MIELYDNGHGRDTVGKRSPDGRLLEYKSARELVREIVAKRKACGADARILVPEEHDVSLAERCRRVNEICRKYGANNVICISIHHNAAGNGVNWTTAGGWCAFTSIGQTKADSIATHLYYAADKHLKGYKERFAQLQKQGAYDARQHAIRMDMSDKDPDYEAGFYILKNTACPCVLTESMFQDNKADVEWLLSPEGRKALVDLHCEGVSTYLESLKH